MLDLWPTDDSRDAAELAHTALVSEAIAESGGRPSDHGPAAWRLLVDAWEAEYGGGDRDRPDWLADTVTPAVSRLAGKTEAPEPDDDDQGDADQDGDTDIDDEEEPDDADEESEG